MMPIHRYVAGVVLLAAAVGCTRVVVHKDPGPHDHGFRYWRPKPYLFIGPLAPDEKKPAGDAGGSGGDQGVRRDTTEIGADGKPKVTHVETVSSIKIAMQIKYLPDYNEEYSVKLKAGIGIGKLDIKLEDGWNLTSVGVQTDQQLPQLITAFGSLLSAATGGGAKGKVTKEGTFVIDTQYTSKDLYIIDTRPDVPLGFYEPIIATDPHGKKSLFGWRYVGFMPFAGCPVQACVQPKAVTCETSDLWGIVATPTSIKFARLTDIESGANPYQYRNFEQRAGHPAPPPGQTPDVTK